MQSILERYHEEQVWSDKVGLLGARSISSSNLLPSQIRSLSTYGSLAITSLNVLLFIITILLVEPWKRKRLVEGVEARSVLPLLCCSPELTTLSPRLRSSTSEGQEATLASLVSLQSLLTDAQAKLDSLVAAPTAQPLTLPREAPIAFQGEDVLDTSSAVPDTDPEAEAMAILARDAEEARLTKAREQELWTMGGIGMLAGIGGSLLVASLAR